MRRGITLTHSSRHEKRTSNLWHLVIKPDNDCQLQLCGKHIFCQSNYRDLFQQTTLHWFVLADRNSFGSSVELLTWAFPLPVTLCRVHWHQPAPMGSCWVLCTEKVSLSIHKASISFSSKLTLGKRKLNYVRKWKFVSHCFLNRFLLVPFWFSFQHVQPPSNRS